jgi:hypothetical protein
MSKFLGALVTTLLFSCTAASRHTSVGPAGELLDGNTNCGACSPGRDLICPPDCPVDCGDVCTFVCFRPDCGECVVTVRCNGGTCTVVSCVALAPGETPPPNARRVECSAVCGSDCRE